MYAVIVSGGKQLKVEQGRIVRVEKLDIEIGGKVRFDTLLINNEGKIVTGNPIANAYVEGEVLAHDKADKINIFKYKAKKNIRKRQGHRQPYTAVKIVEIKA